MSLFGFSAKNLSAYMGSFGHSYFNTDSIDNIDTYLISCVCNQQESWGKVEGNVWFISRWFNSYPLQEYKIDTCQYCRYCRKYQEYLYNCQGKTCFVKVIA